MEWGGGWGEGVRARQDTHTTMERVRARGSSLCDVGESLELKAQELASEVLRIGVADPTPRQEHHCLSRFTRPLAFSRSIRSKPIEVLCEWIQLEAFRVWPISISMHFKHILKCFAFNFAPLQAGL